MTWNQTSNLPYESQTLYSLILLSTGGPRKCLDGVIVSNIRTCFFAFY